MKRCARVAFSHYHQAPILATVLCNKWCVCKDSVCIMGETILNSSDKARRAKQFLSFRHFIPKEDPRNIFPPATNIS